jgi:dynein heavy chain 1
MEVELAQYKTKCKLIRGWDELFALVDDDTNNINSMKMSPYYKVFESEIKPLIQDLEKIRIMFDSWIDVQRKYVYLEGIFFGSADIAQMLSNEFNKFKNIDNEFTKLMTEVKKNPKVKTILEIPNVERQLNNFVMQLEHL